MNELINKIIRKIELDSENQHYLRFTTNEGIFIYETEGDCCSESWFADIIGVQNLLNSKIISVELVEREAIDNDSGYTRYAPKNYNVNDGRGRQDYDSVYAYKFITNKGYSDIIFRNSSNGYYGGWLNYITELPKKKYIKFKEILDDYPN